jgi:hypothetical protein
VIKDIPPGTAKVRIADREVTAPVREGVFKVVLKTELPAGPAQLQTWLETNSGESRGAYFVDVKRLD